MPGEMKFLDIPDGHPLPLEWLRDINDEVFNELVLEIAMTGPALAAINGLDCKPISSGMWRLRHLIGFGKAHYLIFIAIRDGNHLALYGFTGGASSIDAEAMAIAERRLRDLM
jgi:hypothetical protein